MALASSSDFALASAAALASASASAFALASRSAFAFALAALAAAISAFTFAFASSAALALASAAALTSASSLAFAAVAASSSCFIFSASASFRLSSSISLLFCSCLALASAMSRAFAARAAARTASLSRTSPEPSRTASSSNPLLASSSLPRSLSPLGRHFRAVASTGAAGAPAGAGAAANPGETSGAFSRAFVVNTAPARVLHQDASMPTATDEIDVAKGERRTAAATATIATTIATSDPRDIDVGARGFLDGGVAAVSTSRSSASNTSAATNGASSGAANEPPRLESTARAPVAFDVCVCAAFDRVPREGRRSGAALASAMSWLTSLARVASSSRSRASTFAAYSSLSLIAFSVDDMPANSASLSRRLHSSSRESCESSSFSSASLLAAKVSTSRRARRSAASVSRSSSSVISLCSMRSSIMRSCSACICLSRSSRCTISLARLLSSSKIRICAASCSSVDSMMSRTTGDIGVCAPIPTPMFVPPTPSAPWRPRPLSASSERRNCVTGEHDLSLLSRSPKGDAGVDPTPPNSPSLSPKPTGVAIAFSLDRVRLCRMFGGDLGARFKSWMSSRSISSSVAGDPVSDCSESGCSVTSRTSVSREMFVSDASAGGVAGPFGGRSTAATSSSALDAPGGDSGSVRESRGARDEEVGVL